MLVRHGTFRKKMYTRVSNPGESIFLDMNGPFLESLVGNGYWIGVVDDYRSY